MEKRRPRELNPLDLWMFRVAKCKFLLVIKMNRKESHHYFGIRFDFSIFVGIAVSQI